MMSRGLGNILSTPITTTLSRHNGNSTVIMHGKLGFDVGGGKFEMVIIYAGTCFAGAAIIAMIGWGSDRMRPM
jgi:MFS transporter, MCT family, solute carrier family 16 (monocarboxylic acid transporters), member 10